MAEASLLIEDLTGREAEMQEHIADLPGTLDRTWSHPAHQSPTAMHARLTASPTARGQFPAALSILKATP